MRKFFFYLISISIGLFAFTASAQAAATLNGTIHDINGDVITGTSCVTYTVSGTDTDTGTITTNGTFSATVNGGEIYTIAFSSATTDCIPVERTQRSYYLTNGNTIDDNFYLDVPERRGRIRGKVVNARKDNVPIDDIEVRIYGEDAEEITSNYNTTTNSTGNFNTTVPVGNYDIVIKVNNDKPCPLESDSELWFETKCYDYVLLDQEISAGEDLNLGTVNFTGGDDLTVFYITKRNSQGNFDYINFDQLYVIAHSNSGKLIQYATSGATLLGNTAFGRIIQSDTQPYASFVLDADEDWTFDAFAIEGTKAYHGVLSLNAEQIPEVDWTEPRLNEPNQRGNAGQADILVSEVYTYDATAGVDVTFNSTTARTINSSDGLPTGTEVVIPAYAIDDGGNVNVVMEPAFDILTPQYPLNGFSWNLTAYDNINETVSEFNRPITITLPYDEAELVVLGVNESDVQPWYYNETSERWKRVPTPNVTVDTVANTVTFTTYHFSQYGLLADRITDLDIEYTMGNAKKQVRATPRKVRKVRIDELTYDAVNNNVKMRVSWQHKKRNNGYLVDVIKVNSNDRVVRKNKERNKKTKLDKRMHVKFKNSSGLKTNKTYRLRVKAYKWVHSKYIYGKWSKKIKFHTPEKPV
ncbi:MAG: carboxypeptidase-like regulatory domain-containing protein [bacterium]|nr:carboxypeptidase-like regulatory domain-containing protein [bacterium]